MSTGIVPSPAIVARADTPISECVRRMRDHGVGSLLVVSDRGDGSLVGIFTERDLLKSIDLIEQGGHWSKPIRTVMTLKPRTIDPRDLERAGEIMLEAGFRHLPIVSAPEEGGGGGSRILGVISIRDVLRDCHRRLAQAAASARLQPARFSAPAAAPAKVGALSRDTEFVLMLKSAFLGSDEILVRRLSTRKTLDPTQAPAGIYRMKALVLDIDRVPKEHWSAFLRKVNLDPQAPFTFVVFDPGAHPPATVELLRKIGEARRFAVYAKPVDILGFLERLRSVTAAPVTAR